MSQHMIVAIGRNPAAADWISPTAWRSGVSSPCSTRASCKKPQRTRASAPKRWSATMSAPTPPCSAAPFGHQQRPGGSCVAQMQFELLRQHANGRESFVVLGRCARRCWRTGKG